MPALAWLRNLCLLCHSLKADLGSCGPADTRFVLVVDNPSPGPAFEAWLRGLAHRQGGALMGRVRVRRHTSNLGASAARNTLLDESLAEFCVFAGRLAAGVDVVFSSGCGACCLQDAQQHVAVQACMRLF